MKKCSERPRSDHCRISVFLGVTNVRLNRKNALRGIQMTSPDIRAGVSLLIAALSANGKSTIHNIEQIDRGYQDIDIRLNNIGADIRRVG